MNQTVSVKLAFGVVIFSVLSSLAIASIIAAAGTVQSNEHNQNFYNYTALFVGQGFMVVPLLLFLISRKEPILSRLRIRTISSPVVSSVVLISLGLIPLVDEMDDGMDEKLRSIGYDAFSVKKLRADGLKLHTDFSVINYAMENKMILVTRDTENGQACEENNIPCILLDSEEIFKIVLGKLKGYN